MIEDAWLSARDGARQVVVVGGEAGVGKSRLLAEVATTLHRHGAAVLLGMCQAELGQPYQPFVKPIEALMQGLNDGGLALSPHPVDDGASRRRELLGVLAGRRRPPRELGRNAETRRFLYAAATDALLAAASRRPIMLGLEDLQWAGVDGLQLLAFLVEQSADARVLIIVTHRTTPSDRSRAVVQALANLYRLPGVGRLDLDPLDVDDVVEYVAGESGAPPASVRALAAALRETSGGNPFVLRELWRDVSLRGGPDTVDTARLRAPSSVRDTVQSRLDVLPDRYREIIEFAAIVGEQVELEILVAAHEAGEGADGVLNALDAAVDCGLLDGSSEPEQPPLRFPHALARQAVIELMPPSRVTSHHARAAKVIERLPALDRRVQRLALHYRSAHGLGYGPQAVRYLIEAAEQADRALAHEEAARLFLQAAMLADGESREDLRLIAARSHFLAGDFATARDIDEGVARTGTPRQRLRAAIGFEAASWRPGHQGQPAVDLLTEALAGVPREPSDAIYVRAIASLGRAFTFSGAPGEARALSGRAISLARRLGQVDLLAHALQAGLQIGQHPDQLTTRLERATELSDLAERSRNLRQLGAAAWHRSHIAYMRGDPPALDAAYADLRRAARATGQRYWQYLAEGIVYAKQFMAGDLAGAAQTVDDLLTLGESLGTTGDTEGPYGVQSYMLQREAGQLGAVRHLISGNEPPDQHWAPGLLALYTELGLTEPARRLLQWFLDGQMQRYETSGDWPATLAFLVEAAVALGHDEAARTLRPRLLDYAQLNLVAGPFIAIFGSADRYVGTVDSMLGRTTAEEWFGSALELDTRTGSPVHRAQTLAAHAVHLRRVHHESEKVNRLVEEAYAIAEPLSQGRVLRQLGPIGSTARGLEARPDGLTAREVEVLALLAAGYSNRDIAARLVISENTAANHVRSILFKTGSSNRTQAARYAANHDLMS